MGKTENYQASYCLNNALHPQTNIVDAPKGLRARSMNCDRFQSLTSWPWLNGANGALLIAMMSLTACTTSGKDGIFSGVTGKKNASGQTQQLAAGKPGVNPNAGSRLINTKSALTDYCPAVRIRSGTETLRTFPKGADKENADNIRYQITITDAARECEYVGQSLRIKVGAKGRVITGPKGKAGNVTMPIRVAVVVGQETVYSKLHRPVQTIAEGSNGATFTFVDDQLVIPAPSKTNVRIYLGFDEGPYNTP